jgi:cell division protein FtsA
MAKNDLVAGLDVGTSSVSLCTGQIQEGLLHTTSIVRVVNSGLRRGMVVDMEETISAISLALEETERKTGQPLSSVYVGIGGAHINSTNSKGVIAVSRADGEITPSDVDRVIEASRAVAMPPNREILHVIPRNFTVDGQTGISDPIGMIGIRLEVETHVVGGSSSAIKNLSKCIYQAGLEIRGMVFSPLASAKMLLSKKQKEIGVALVDLGAGTTSIAVFEEGDVIHCNVLPIGSLHITNDIAIGLKTSLEVAEQVKIQFGQALPDDARSTQIIDLSKIDKEERGRTTCKEVAEIIQARLDEIFALIKNDLKGIGKEGMLPAGVVFTGGGAKLTGICEAAKEGLKLPAQIGKPVFEAAGTVDKFDDPIYSTAVGLVLYGLEVGEGVGYQMSGGKAPKMGNIIGRAKDFFKQFWP